MKHIKYVLVALVLLMAGCVVPPPTTETTTTVATTTSVVATTVSTTTTTLPVTTTTVPPTLPGLYVNPAGIPAPAVGVNVPRIVRAGYSPTPDDIGAFRINCQLSHMRWDDPIVRPGVSGSSHLHSFFGNTGANYASTPGSIRTTGNTTCTGGTANRSSYWAPTMIDTATNRPVLNTTQVSQDNFLQVYYKSGYQGVRPETIQNYPVGLRMIAGDMMATGPQANVWYECGKGISRTIPSNCDNGSLLIMSVEFPQCWDGRNLDSPNHKSHMSYGAGWPDKGCPASHPVPLAQITQNYRYSVGASGTATWRLSSDINGVAPGISGHADWMNGWDPAVFQRVVDNCYHRSMDCGMNLLGDGWMLG